MRSIVQAISTWPLVALVLGLAAMFIFREAISTFISRSHEWKAGRFSAKAKPSAPDPRMVAQTVREILEDVAGQEHLDLLRLVIRDSDGRPRILASTVPSGEPFIVLLDEDREVRASFVLSSNADPSGVAMLTFSGKGQPAGDMASVIGAERDGSGIVGVRDSSGGWKEMS